MDYVLGIDISKWQGKIDWVKVKKAGYEFAFIRTNDGNLVDPTFEVNIKNAIDAGIIVGSYFYFRFREKDSDIIKQVDLSCNMLMNAVGENGKLPPGILPPVLDVEENNKLSLPEQRKTDQLLIALTQMKNLTNLYPILYTMPGYWNSNFTKTNFEYKSYPLWLAHVTDKEAPMKINGWEDWLIWQYSHTGKVPGIKGAVDLNRWNGNLDDLQWFARLI